MALDIEAIKFAISLLKKMTDNELDPKVMEKVNAWSDPPKSIEVLEVLDLCIYYDLASSFVVSVLQVIYRDLCAIEGVTHEMNSAIADQRWRKDPGSYSPE